jgi:hypothetical protein
MGELPGGQRTRLGRIHHHNPERVFLAPTLLMVLKKLCRLFLSQAYDSLSEILQPNQHIISFVAFLSTEWSLTLSWQNLQVKSWLQQVDFSLQFRL